MRRAFEIGDRVRVTFGGNDYCAYRDDPWSGDPIVGDEGVVTGFAEGTWSGASFVVVRLDASGRERNSVGDDGWRLLPDWIEHVDNNEEATPSNGAETREA